MYPNKSFGTPRSDDISDLAYRSDRQSRQLFTNIWVERGKGEHGRKSERYDLENHPFLLIPIQCQMKILNDVAILALIHLTYQQTFFSTIRLQVVRWPYSGIYLLQSSMMYSKLLELVNTKKPALNKFMTEL